MKLQGAASDPELAAALEQLYKKERRFVDLNPEATRKTLAALGDPQRRYRTVQIGGTNGKGSVAAMVAAAATAGPGDTGVRVGLFTSPHLVRWMERIQVDGVPLSERAALAAIRSAAEGATAASVELTFFEATTVAALLHFARVEVDLAILEVGLGGRLDATSAAAPGLTAVVNVDIDHTRTLGADVETIAVEKAGIARPGVLLVSGVVEEGPREVLRRVCASRGAPMAELGGDFDFESLDRERISYRGPAWLLAEVLVPLRGRHQHRNAAIALRILEALAGDEGPPAWDLLPQRVLAGLGRTHWPARFECIDRPDGGRVFLDVAHNAAGARALADCLAEERGEAPVHLVYGGMADKDQQSMLGALLPQLAAITFTRPDYGRAADPEELLELVKSIDPRVVAHAAGGRPAVDVVLEAVRRAAPGVLVAVAGSLYLLGEVRGAVLAHCGASAPRAR